MVWLYSARIQDKMRYLEFGKAFDSIENLLSVYFSLRSLFLSLSHSLSLSSLFLSVSPSLNPLFNTPFCLSLFLCFFLCSSHFLLMPYSIFISVFLSLFVSLPLCLSVCLSFSKFLITHFLCIFLYIIFAGTRIGKKRK